MAGRPGPAPAVPPDFYYRQGQVRAELDKVDALLEGLLALARAQHGVLPGRAVLPLDYVVSAALTAREDAIAARNGRVRWRQSRQLDKPPGNQTAFLSAEDLLETAWDENADPFTTTVTVTISRLRRKLGNPPVITTTQGVGYRIASQTPRDQPL